MNAKTVEEILTVLAAKLGTTAAHLWDVLVRQAYVEGALAVFWVVVSVAIIYNATVRLPKALKAAQEARYDEDAPFVVQSVVWAMLFCTFVIVGGVNFDIAVTSLGNPEYAALKLVLGAFSN